MRLGLALVFLLFSRFALADAVPPMPEMTCDPGARWSISHDGGSCNPTECQSNDQCEKGQVCQTQGLCITFTTKYGRPNGTPYSDSSAYGTCGPKSACASGQCEVVKRCVPKGTKATPGPENKLTPPDPNKPTPEPDPKTPEPQPESQPDETPDSTPTKTNPPTKVDKGRCSVSPTGELPASLLGLFLAFALFLKRQRR